MEYIYTGNVNDEIETPSEISTLTERLIYNKKTKKSINNFQNQNQVNESKKKTNSILKKKQKSIKTRNKNESSENEILNEQKRINKRLDNIEELLKNLEGKIAQLIEIKEKKDSLKNNGDKQTKNLNKMKKNNDIIYINESNSSSVPSIKVTKRKYTRQKKIENSIINNNFLFYSPAHDAKATIIKDNKKVLNKKRKKKNNLNLTEVKKTRKRDKSITAVTFENIRNK